LPDFSNRYAFHVTHSMCHIAKSQRRDVRSRGFICHKRRASEDFHTEAVEKAEQ
jgi:hypothetical protein